MDMVKKALRFSLPALISYFLVFRLSAGICQLTGVYNAVAVTVFAVIAGIFAIYLESAFCFTSELSDKTVAVIVTASALLSPFLKFADSYISGEGSDVLSAWGFGCILCVFALMLFIAFKCFFRGIRPDIPDKKETLFVLLIWAVTTFITVFCAIKSNEIYTYDYVIYHERAAFYINLLKTDPIALCGRIYTSFGTDYSGLPSLFAMPFMLIFGNLRPAYVFALSIYNLLAYMMLFIITKKVTKKTKISCLTVLLEFPLFIFLPMKGVPDIGCVAIGLTVLYICLFSNIDSKNGGFLSGVLLASGFLFRRYFLMFAIGFIVVMLIDYIRRKKIMYPIFCISGMAMTMLLPFQKMMVNTLLMRNYGDAYSYYQLGTAVNIEYFIKAFGLILILAMIIGCVFLRKNRIVMLSLAGLTVTIASFLITQSPNKHHMTIFMTWAVVIMLFVNELLIKRGKKITAALLCAAVVQSGVCFVPVDKYPFFHNMLIKPDTQSAQDVECYRQVSDFLTENMNEDEFAYTLGVSGDFSESKLKMVNFVLTGELKYPSLLTAALIDSRDKLPQEFFDAKYIIVTDPIQYERGEEHQQVVKIPAEMLLNSQGWATAYKRLDNSCELEKGITIYIYEKTREVTEEERASLSYLM